MRQNVVKALKSLDAVSVENPCRPGTPDVNYVEGWLELKWDSAWPIRPETNVAIDHYTPQQRLWSMRRWTRGGTVHLLLQVADDWLLFPGDVASKLVGNATRAELLDAATWVFRGPGACDALCKYLSTFRRE